LENNNECLVIEAGVRFLEVKKALDFNVRKIVGCIITHEHGDHAKYAMDYLKAGIPVLCSVGTQVKISTGLLQPYHCYHGKKFTLGNFQIMPFDIQHDAAEPFGFIIKHPETGKVLFLTDSHYSEYTFKGLNQIIVEANYSEEILQHNIDHGKIDPSMRKRLETSHMSLKTCVELLKANDLTEVLNIVLIHLSRGNSNANQFLTEVIATTGKRVYVAETGLTISFNDLPF
jgi:phosphoribosyl 1,2-cyclic phosphodiesterase